jgi:hypothetical protein
MLVDAVGKIQRYIPFIVVDCARFAMLVDAAVKIQRAGFLRQRVDTTLTRATQIA